MAKWHEANREYNKARLIKWREENREYCLAYDAQRESARREKKIKVCAEWYIKNRDRHIANVVARRARKKERNKL